MRLALALVALGVTGAVAAELPTRSEKPKPVQEKARTCEIGGERGIALPGGGCVRVGGYVSVGVSAGTLRR